MITALARFGRAEDTGESRHSSERRAMTARLSLTNTGNVLRLDAMWGYETADGVGSGRRRPSFYPYLSRARVCVLDCCFVMFQIGKA